MNRSMPGLPVHHQLPEFTQSHVHRVGDAIQPSHPLSSPSPPAQSLPASESFPMSQLFTWGGQSTEVSALASFLPKNTQDWSPLEWTGLVYLILHHIDILTIVFWGNNFKFTFCKNRNRTYIFIYSTQIHLLIFYSIYFITYIGDFSLLYLTSKLYILNFFLNYLQIGYTYHSPLPLNISVCIS